MQTTERTRLRKLPLLVALSAALFAGGAIAGPGPGKDKGGDSAQHFARMAERLSLSEEQQASWRALHESGREEAMAERQRAREIQRELQAMRGDFDRARASELADELGAIEARQALRRAEHQAAIYQMLEPEQRERWDAAAERRQDQAGKADKRGEGRRNGAPEDS